MSVSRRGWIAIAAATAVALAVAAVLTSGRADPATRPAILEVEIQASAGAAAQLFWSDSLPIFDEARSMRVPFGSGQNTMQRLRFVVPGRGLRWFRFDPSDAPSEILIGELTLFNAAGVKLGTIASGALQPIHDIASIEHVGRLTRIVTSPSGGDPYLFALAGHLWASSPRERLFLVTPLSAALVSVLVLALLGNCTVAIGRSALSRRETLMSGADSDVTRTVALWAAALALGVFAARLLVLLHYPLTFPYQDQWDAEARSVFIPLDAGSLSWLQMFSLHNEHRVFFSRLLSLDLRLLDRQWDPRLQQVVNAALQSLLAVLLVLMLWVRMGRRRIVLLTALVAVAFGLPFAWENILQGFQSAFLFLEIFSLLALWMTTAYPVGSRQWYLGWLCAVCGLFTAAGGLTIPAAIAITAAVSCWVDRAPLRRLLTVLAFSAVVLALGVLVQSPPLAHHAALKARSVTDFAGAFGRNLAWPWINRPAFALLMWLPIAVAMTRTFRHRRADADPFLIGVAAWVAMQAAAIAYGRGVGGAAPASRYQDALALGLVVNTCVLALWLDRIRGRLAARAGRGLLAVWMLLTAIGIDGRVQAAVADLTGISWLWNAQETNLHRFVMTGDVAELSTHPVDQLAYPDAMTLASVASQVAIQRILPARVRAPLHVAVRGTTDDAFVVDGINLATPRDPLRPSWGSLSARGPLGVGRFESEPLAPCDVAGRLAFQVTGYLGFPEERLTLRRTDVAREVEVRPRGLAGSAWMTVTAPCPDGPFEIVGADSGPYWFGFREPAEIGTASAIAESLIDASPRLVLLALALAMMASMCAARLDGVKPSP